MTTEIFGVLAVFLGSVALAWPLGRYIARIYAGDPHWTDRIFGPAEGLIFRLSGLDPRREMGWQEHLKTMLTLNAVWFVLVLLVLSNMAWLPLNPDGNPSTSPDLAFNTAVSFLVNANLQHYSGETGLSYLGQMSLMFLQFVSAATGLAMAAVVFNALKSRQSSQLGNFYVYFLKSGTRILLPLCGVVATILLLNGTPMTFAGRDNLVSLEGDSVQVSRGPVAAFVAIKHLGTNGGGFFGANSAHPLENPTYLTAGVELLAQSILPLAMVFGLGFYLRRRRLALMIFGVMTAGFLLLAVPTIGNELGGNPALSSLDQSLGHLEGQEMRFGAAMSGYWSILTTVISTGSVNAMHDSMLPLSGLNQLLAMMVNCFYGGCGVGLLNFYLFLLLAVFMSGLMVGRTPEFLGKKVEAREVKIAMLMALLHPLLILAGTALASWRLVEDPALPWLHNPGFHGFSTLLYEFTSASANNGSGYEGLGDNTPFWNISTGLVLLLSRYLPIIGPVAIAGLLAAKPLIPESAGTLQTDTATFGVMVFAVIAIVAALAFFPALALGPLAEYFSG